MAEIFHFSHATRKIFLDTSEISARKSVLVISATFSKNKGSFRRKEENSIPFSARLAFSRGKRFSQREPLERVGALYIYRDGESFSTSFFLWPIYPGGFTAEFQDRYS